MACVKPFLMAVPTSGYVHSKHKYIVFAMHIDLQDTSLTPFQTAVTKTLSE